MYRPATSKRVSIAPNLASTLIVVKAKRHVLILPLLVFWFGTWSVLGGSAIFLLVFGKHDMFEGAWMFLLFWFSGWAIGGIFVASMILWMLFGREKFEINSAAATKTVAVAGISWEWHYNPQLIRNVRRNFSVNNLRTKFFEPPSVNDALTNFMGFPSGKNGKVAFDYGGRTVSFGMQLVPAEADLIVEAISQRLSRKEWAAA